MSLYIKLFGLALLLISALSTVKRYREYNRRRIAEEEGFVSLLNYIKGRIKRYLTPVSEIVKEFSDEGLSRTGFLKEAAEGKSMISALESTYDKLSVCKEFKEVLKNAFSAIGVGYKDEVLSNLEEATDNLEKILEKEKETLHKDEKVFSSVLVAGVLGLFILLA